MQLSITEQVVSNLPPDTGWRMSAARPAPPTLGRRAFISVETTNDDIHNTHNRLRRRFAAILDDLDQSSLLLPLPFDDVGSEENGGQDADELD